MSWSNPAIKRFKSKIMRSQTLSAVHAHKLYRLSSSLSQHSVGILETCMSMISSKYLGFRAKDSAHSFINVKRALAQLEGKRITLHCRNYGEFQHWWCRLAWIKNLASPSCLHIGPIANRGVKISQPSPHLQTNANESGNNFRLGQWNVNSWVNEPASLGQNLSKIQSSIFLRAGHAISLLTSKTCRSSLRVGHVKLK